MAASCSRIARVQLLRAYPRMRVSETAVDHHLRKRRWAPLHPMQDDTKVTTCFVQAVARTQLRRMDAVDRRWRVEESDGPVRADTEIEMVVLSPKARYLRLKGSGLLKALAPHNRCRRMDEISAEHVVEYIGHVIRTTREARGRVSDQIRKHTRRCMSLLEVHDTVSRVVRA